MALAPFLFQDTNYWKQQLWSAHDRVECEVMQGMHDQGLPVVKVKTASKWLVDIRCGRGVLLFPRLVTH